MPKHVKARAAQDPQEERQVRKLAKSVHAPADGKVHAQMVLLSWTGKTPNEIAAELGCHPQTVRIHLKRFTAEGIAGLGMRTGSGRKPRLTEQERSRILALAKQEPPGHLSAQADGTMVARDEEGEAHWTLNALAQAAKAAGIQANAVRSVGFMCVKACAGVTPIVGEPAMIRTSSQKNRGRLPLHPAAPGVDDRLYRRTGASSSPYLPSSAWLVCQWPPHQSAAGLQSRPRENLGLWRTARARWQGAHQMCRLAQLDELHRAAFRHRSRQSGRRHLHDH
jgi:transposase